MYHEKTSKLMGHFKPQISILNKTFSCVSACKYYSNNRKHHFPLIAMIKRITALLFVSAAAAEYNLTYLDVLWQAAPTLTLVSSNAIATTYELECPTTTTSTPTTSTPFQATEYYPDSTYRNLNQSPATQALTLEAKKNSTVRKRGIFIQSLGLLLHRSTSRNPAITYSQMHPFYLVPRPRDIWLPPHGCAAGSVCAQRRLHVDGRVYKSAHYVRCGAEGLDVRDGVLEWDSYRVCAERVEHGDFCWVCGCDGGGEDGLVGYDDDGCDECEGREPCSRDGRCE